MAGQVEKILKHRSLWEGPARESPAESATADRDAVQEALSELSEVVRVASDEFLADW